MNGAFLLLVPVGVLVYLYTKGSESTSRSKTSTESNFSSTFINTNIYSNPSPSQKNSYSTTGEFARSTEGFIPTDKCECGGQWVKHVNKTTGGRFFGCSRYPSCDNTRDKQQAKNFCSNGHARTSQNTAYNADGSRRCLVCRPFPIGPLSSTFRNSNTERNTGPLSSKDTSLYCRNGHKRTTENTYVRPNGERECGICRKNAR